MKALKLQFYQGTVGKTLTLRAQGYNVPDLELHQTRQESALTGTQRKTLV